MKKTKIFPVHILDTDSVPVLSLTGDNPKFIAIIFAWCLHNSWLSLSASDSKCFFRGVLHTIILKKVLEKNSHSRNLLVPFLSFLLRNWLQDLKGPKSNVSDVCWKNMESRLHSLNKINGTHLLRLVKGRRWICSNSYRSASWYSRKKPGDWYVIC